MKSKAEMPPPQSLKLKDIHGVHPLVQTVQVEVGGSLRNRPSGVIGVQGLLEIAQHFPLHVVSSKGLYLCIGGIALFRLLQVCASPDTDIPVVIHDRITRVQLADFIRVELFIVPAFFAVCNKDVSRLGAVWSQLATTELFTRILHNPGAQALANLLGRDKRTILRGQHDNTSQQQSNPALKKSEEACPRSVEEDERKLIRPSSESATTLPKADAVAANPGSVVVADAEPIAEPEKEELDNERD